ncbi:MAG: glycosyltransferase [Prolixibacteraceae bacterium]|nr:glycosyltransferase [Prolixibacteraceae bacterium]
MKFCFYGGFAGALKGLTPGGAELQVALLSKALALKGHEVVIIDPYSKESFVTEEGVILINVPEWNKGIKGVRLFLNRIPLLWKMLTEQNADYYYVRMREYLHLIPYLAAKKTKGKFIIGIAHDLDTLGIIQNIKYDYKFNIYKFFTLDLPNDLVFNYLLKKSDYITLQHSGQKIKTNSVKGKIGIFPNIFDQRNLPVVEDQSKDYYIHVGSLTVMKGIKNLYQLVRILDRKNLIMIVGQPKGRISNKIYTQLRKFDNVILKGRMNHEETLRLIANSKGLINLSNFEGFPNIFLEAWATGVPVISLNVNPGNVINKYNLGLFCDGNLNKMKTCIELEETQDIDKNRLISYVSEFHDFNSAADRFLILLQQQN